MGCIGEEKVRDSVNHHRRMVRGAAVELQRPAVITEAGNLEVRAAGRSQYGTRRQRSEEDDER
jgi:hypothetical protein